MRLGLTLNVDSKKCIKVAQDALRILEKGKAEVFLEERSAKALGREGISIAKMKVDAIVTVGGDGMILRALQESNTKILGINVGAVGFLTELKITELEDGLKKLLKNEFSVEKRSKLRVMINDKRLQDCTNEVVVNTAHIGKMRHFGIHINGQLASDVRADGIIVASSTGSTCYAMSVGGPIIDPKLDAMVVAPIAPFKIAARPIVAPADSKIAVEIIEKEPCVVVLDGQTEIPLENNETVNVSLSSNKTSFIRFSDNFYGKIRDKLGG
jgi:NAD+ kinase